MPVGLGQYMEQTQKLIMTPDLRQAITILQLNAIELSTYIEQEMTQNPLLELSEQSGDKEERIDTAEANLDTYEQGEQGQGDDEKAAPDWQEFLQRDFAPGLGLGGTSPEKHYDYFLNEAPTLQEHLSEQLHMADLDDAQRRIGEYIIGNIDEQGYFRLPLDEVAAALRYPEGDVQEVLQLIQSFDPPGVAARDLAECLRIQLIQKEMLTPQLDRIVKEHLSDLAAGRLSRVAQKLKLPTGQVQDLVDIVKSLDPKPGRKFSHGKDVRYVLPDVVVEKMDGEYVILVNDITAPRLKVNGTYRSLLQQETPQDPETRKYVEQKLNSAIWLIKAIEQRRLTLHKVVDCIVELQRDFLERGLPFLKPLNLKDVADSVGVHESTVSRAIAGKYVQTPRGVFELKFFFGSGVKNKRGEAKTSAESIKGLIRKMVDEEDAYQPYSDQQIADALSARGIKISRRTVAKYRDEMGLLATPQRRRYS
ncbi:RNA polymerase factor sigma-54 [Heliobacterium chlorum]|uniref:RNA polymerase factor sigma-54 n=1 Tax=Heliobacterium chlorum TaxID=2698 RepID=A0ABR7T2N2_HELCL|nr:RNA polymerase factor sigma-54 [Heliobacterium chlorum]MBC9784283.1 RNA polymerase factor sigma-54 [Heliobacterium chlorum]